MFFFVFVDAAVFVFSVVIVVVVDQCFHVIQFSFVKSEFGDGGSAATTETEKRLSDKFLNSNPENQKLGKEREPIKEKDTKEEDKAEESREQAVDKEAEENEEVQSGSIVDEKMKMEAESVLELLDKVGHFQTSFPLQAHVPGFLITVNIQRQSDILTHYAGVCLGLAVTFLIPSLECDTT